LREVLGPGLGLVGKVTKSIAIIILHKKKAKVGVCMGLGIIEQEVPDAKVKCISLLGLL
jgi:hypothetical protein